MKKSQQDKSKSKPKKNINKNSDSLSDMGIAPPKIYRESQKNIVTPNNSAKRQSPNSRKNKPENITRAEKRSRDNKKRKKKNTLRKIFIYTVLVLVVISVGLVLSLTTFFNITDITVVGNKKYSAEEIVSHCGINTGDNLFLADTDNAKQMLEKNLPYIYNAKISRKLPYTIEIDVTEAKSAYYIANKDKTYILLDDALKVLEVNSKKPDGIQISKAKIKSAAAGETIEFENADTGDCLIQMAQIIKANSFTEITAIYSNGKNDNYAVYDKRITFKLGSCDNLENKLYKGLASCEKLNNTSPNVVGDMDISGDKSIYFSEKTSVK